MSASRKPSSSRSASGVQPATAPESQDRKENRRARRRREKEKRDSEAGPSGSSNDSLSKIPSKEQNGEKGESDKKPSTSVKGKSTFEEADFIAFTVSEEEAEVAEEPSGFVREWDKGKGKERDTGRDHGRKRKLDEFDLNDGYANKKHRVAAASRRAPWAANVDWESCTNVAEMLHRDVEAFVQYISPTPEEDEVRTLIVTLITRVVCQMFPDAQVLPFGSYETKLYLPVGDIDLVIHSQSMAYSDKETVLYALANTMKHAGITDRVKIIARAKVPIVKFVTAYGRFSVDISINQINGVAAGKMIKQFLGELPALRSLVLVIKSFLSQRSMNEVYTGGLGSYSIVCLAISFLQMHPKMRRGEIDPSKNLGVLVMEFFELYGCYFNYHEVGISLRDGGTYFNKAERGWLDYGQPKLLSIEDPGDPSNDISKGSYGIVKVRTTLAGAHGIMTAAAYLQAGIISAKREGRQVHLRDSINPEEMSILASVMGVTQETINHRRLVKEVYDCQVLHRILGIAPEATIAPVISPTASNRKTREAHKESVKSAWGEADMDLASGSERDVEVPQEDESRYKIDDRRQPPKKRRKMGREQDMHTVFTSDDEDEDASRYEYDEYDLIEGGEDKSSTDAKRRAEKRSENRKRDFWLSKGGMASDSGD